MYVLSLLQRVSSLDQSNRRPSRSPVNIRTVRVYGDHNDSRWMNGWYGWYGWYTIYSSLVLPHTCRWIRIRRWHSVWWKDDDGRWRHLNPHQHHQAAEPDDPSRAPMIARAAVSASWLVFTYCAIQPSSQRWGLNFKNGRGSVFRFSVNFFFRFYVFEFET